MINFAATVHVHTATALAQTAAHNIQFFY